MQHHCRLILRAGLLLSSALCLLVAAGHPVQAQSPAVPSPETTPTLTEADKLSDQAEQFLKQGKYADAMPLAQRALKLRQEQLKSPHKLIADSLRLIGDLYRLLGDYDQALLSVQQAVIMHEQVLGPEQAEVAKSLASLGRIYYYRSNYKEVETIYKRALAIREKVLGPENSETAASLTDLATMYMTLGDYGQAELLQKRALTIQEKVLGPEHPLVAVSLDSLGQLYLRLGDYKLAEGFFRHCLAIREKVLGPEHPDVAKVLNNLAISLYTAHNNSEVKSLFERVLAIQEKTLGPEHPFLAYTLNNLAGVYSDDGEPAKADPLFKRAIAIQEKSLGPEHHALTTILMSLASNYVNMGNYEQAEQLYLRAIAIQEKALGPENPGVAEVLQKVTLFYLDRHAHQANLSSQVPLKYLAHGLEIQEKNLSLNLALGVEERKREYLNSFRDSTDIAISAHLQSIPEDPIAARLALETILRRKGRLLDQLSNTLTLAALRRRLGSSEQTLLDQVTTKRNQLAKLIYQPITGSLDVQKYQAAVNQSQQELEQLEDQLATRRAEFRSEQQPITLTAMQKRLPANAAMIELVRYRPLNFAAIKLAEQFGAEHYAAYTLLPDGSIQGTDLGEAQKIDQMVADLRQSLSSPGKPIRAVRAQAHQLYEQIVQPLQPFLGAAHHLLISPDGSLHLLPFAPLVDGQGHYLIEKFTLTYINSGRDLLRVAESPATAQKPLILANPSFQSARWQVESRATLGDSSRGSDDNPRSVELAKSLSFSPLPWTSTEAKAVQSILNLPDERVLTGEQATENVLKQVHGPALLHIATHGFFFPDARRVDGQPIENPLLRSGLILAGAQNRASGGEDGIISALELADLDLRGTQLVVLSACQTGLGEVSSGEGVYGLRRALILAGAGSQLVSLWQVADKATAQLMSGYYQKLRTGAGRSEAMRQEQLRWLRSASGALLHPYYWASFLPSGDWQPLPVSTFHEVVKKSLGKKVNFIADVDN